MKILKGLLIFLAVLVLVYLLGPKPKKVKLNADLPVISATIENIESYIAESESKVANVKPENASQIIWADSVGKKTEYVFVYLHGFSAGPMEGDPVHKVIAERYGANLYLPRLYGHGIDEVDALLDVTPEKLLASAKEALAIGKLLGDKVILMSCSTGGTLSLYLAAHHPDIYGLIAYSPNIGIAEKGSGMLIAPWGLQFTRMMFNGKYYEWEASDEVKKYWTTRYRIEGIINLQLLVHQTMKTSIFEAVHQPLMVGYYYKNEEEKDDVVSIPKINEMFSQVATPEASKRKVIFENAASHVVNSGIQSKDIETVIKETDKFCNEVLKMQPIVVPADTTSI
jgi:esterase/lipase